MPISVDTSFLRFLESAKECEQGSLADSVLSEEAVDATFLQSHVDVLQDEVVR